MMEKWKKLTLIQIQISPKTNRLVLDRRYIISQNLVQIRQ